jgi:heme A synthase
MPLAAAAVLVLAAGAFYTRLEAPAPLVMTAPPQATAPVSTAPLLVTLTLGTSRAAGDATIVTIPKDTAIVEMRVRLDPADRFDTYGVDVRGAGDLVVWRGTGLTASTIDGILTVTARIPAPSLTGGPHEVAVRGGGTDLGFVPLTIRWSP